MAEGISISHVVGMCTFAAGFVTLFWLRRFRRPHVLHYCFAVLVLWMSMTFFWSVARELTAVRVGSLLQLLLMVWLIWEFAPSQSDQIALLGSYVLGSYVSAFSTIYAFLTHTGTNLGLAEGRYTATGFDENELGVTLALSLVMSFYLLARRLWWWPLWLLHIPICIFAIVLTGSRGGFITTAVAALIFPLTLTKIKRVHRWALVSILIAFGVSAATIIPSSSLQRLGTIWGEVSAREGTLGMRTSIWAAGIDVYRQHPITGVGFGAFGPSVYSRLDIAYVAHNSYLSILVELGLVGAALFGALILCLFYIGFSLSGLERRLWTVLLLTWSVAVLSLTWEHRKPTWFLFGLLIAQSNALQHPSGTRMVGECHLPERRRNLSHVPA